MNSFKTKCIIPLSLFFSIALYSQTPLNIWSLHDDYTANRKFENKYKSNQEHIVFYNMRKDALENALKRLKNNEYSVRYFPLANGNLVAFNVTESSMFAPGQQINIHKLKLTKVLGLMIH